MQSESRDSISEDFLSCKRLRLLSIQYPFFQYLSRQAANKIGKNRPDCKTNKALMLIQLEGQIGVRNQLSGEAFFESDALERRIYEEIIFQLKGNIAQPGAI